jgi:hypothetical protein
VNAKKRPTVRAILKRYGACEESLEWAKPYGTDRAKAWAECPRGDWMCWLLGKFAGEVGSPSRRKLVGCLADVAETALPYYEAIYPNDSRVRDAIHACRRYAAGEISLDELNSASAAAFAADAAAYAARAAASAAADAAASAARAAADAAAYAAARAARAAADAAAYAAAYAACAAARAAARAAASAARAAADAASTEIVRKHYPKAPTLPRKAVTQ